MAYLRYNILLFQIGGQFTLENSNSALIILYNYWRTFSPLLLILFAVFSADVIREKDIFDFNSIALSYVYIVCSLWTIIKTTYFSTYENQCKNLLFQMNHLFKFTTTTSLDEISMKRRLSFTNKLTVIWCVTMMILGLITNLLPVFSKTRNLPFLLSLPYNWTMSPYYELTFFTESIVIWTVVIQVIPTEIFFMCVVLVITEQFRLLGWEIKNLFYTTLVQNNMPRELVLLFREFVSGEERENYRNVENKVNFDQVHVTIKSNKFQKDIVKNMHQLIKFHQSLLLYCADLEDFFSPIMLMFVPFMASILISVSVVILTATSSEVLLPYFPVCTYLYFQISISCYFGNFYTSEYDRLRMDLYGSPWYYCNEKYKKLMSIMIQNLSKPVTFTVGKCSNINLELLFSVIKSIISYCMVIFQLSQRT